MDSQSRPVVVAEPPRGAFSARMDEKGRVKLPAAVQEYLESFGTKKVFITTLDVETARIYPISVWRSNEIVLDGAVDDPEIAEDVSLIANLYGQDCEMDGQGRVLFPTNLRRELALEDAQIWLDTHQGVINVYSNATFEAKKQRALEGLAAKVRKLKEKGLK
ncbi:MAG: hypothetical protein K2X35_22370 [Bryobacteraceae bacterium]|nr:hypothetical protein [Bryobacteraceae bacterium]